MRKLKVNEKDPYSPTINQYMPGLDKANLKKLRGVVTRKPSQSVSEEITNVGPRILKTYHQR